MQTYEYASRTTTRHLARRPRTASKQKVPGSRGRGWIRAKDACQPGRGRDRYRTSRLSGSEMKDATQLIRTYIRNGHYEIHARRFTSVPSRRDTKPPSTSESLQTGRVDPRVLRSATSAGTQRQTGTAGEHATGEHHHEGQHGVTGLRDVLLGRHRRLGSLHELQLGRGVLSVFATLTSILLRLTKKTAVSPCFSASYAPSVYGTPLSSSNWANAASANLPMYALSRRCSLS